MNLTLPLVTSAAFLDSINPCAISVLLLTIGFLFSLNSSRERILKVVGLYIIAIYLTYILIGVGVLSALTFFGVPHILTKAGAVLLIIYGLFSLCETLIPNFPVSLSIPKFIKPHIAKLMYQASSPSAFFMGILVGLFEFPCTGGPYLMILALLHDKSAVVPGTLYLLYYNFIFVLPLILITLISVNSQVMSKMEAVRHSNSRQVSIFSSIATIILGIIIFSL